MNTISGHSPLFSGRTVLRPLIPVALAIMAGGIIGIRMPGFFWPVLASLSATTVWIIRRALQRRALLCLPLLLIIGTGYLGIQPWLRSDTPPRHVSHYTDQGKWQVAGTIIESPRADGHWMRFTMDVNRLMQGTRQVHASGKLRVNVRGTVATLTRGDSVVVIGHLRAVRGFCNFGGFNYERHMAFQGVRARLSTQAEYIRCEPSQNTGWAERLDQLRDRLGRQMAERLSTYPIRATLLLKALTLGERAGLPPNLQELFQRTGVSHVLAISGLHVGMVGAASFSVLYRLLTWVPALRRCASVRRTAAVLTLAPVIGYALLAGLSPATQRAMIMLFLLLAGYWIGRPHDWLNVLGAAALIIFLAFPPILMRISFQLSFAAVLAIILGRQARPFAFSDPSAQWSLRLLLRLKALFQVSVLAILGTLPLVMHHFNIISWVGPVTNLVVVPLVGIVVLPSGLLGILLMPICPFLSVLLWKTASLGLLGGVWFMEWIARLPFAAVTTVTPTVLEMVLFYLLLAVCLNWQRRALRITGLAIVLAAGCADGLYWYQRRFNTQQMTVIAVDVGQGSANLLRLPGGITVLVDGGGFSDNLYFDVGRQVLAPLLRREKIKTIDLVILTHPDSDHVNGLIYLLNHFRVGEVWSNHEPADTLGYRQWQQALRDHRIDHPPFDQLERCSVHNGVRFEIFAPPLDFRQRSELQPWRNANSNSLVVRVSWQNVSFLFPGDITAPAEKEMVDRHGADKLKSTILFVPHHGSRTSSSSELLQAVQSVEGIISVGWQNRFGLPHASVTSRLATADYRIWRTDLCGAVRIITNGKTYHVASCRKGCTAAHHPLECGDP